MKVRPATDSDANGMARLFRDHHPSASGPPRLSDQQARLFVAEHRGEIVGLAMASYLNDGVHSYGIIHFLEAAEPRRTDAARQLCAALRDACHDWLCAQDTTFVVEIPEVQASYRPQPVIQAARQIWA